PMELDCCKLGYPENKPSSVPHLPPLRRPVVPETANVPTAKGVLNSNFRCGSRTVSKEPWIDVPSVSVDTAKADSIAAPPTSVSPGRVDPVGIEVRRAQH